MVHPAGTLEITTAKTCSVNCAPICPQMAFRETYDALILPMAGQPEHRPARPDQFLSLENFKKALESVPSDVRIDFAGFAEPFMNIRAIDMMEYAYQKGHAVDLFSTFQGATPETVERLRNIKFGSIVLHTPDNEGNAKILPTANYLKVRYLVETRLPVSGISRMSREFGFVSNERAGNCEGTDPKPIWGPFICNRLTPASFVLLPNGGCVLCCQDWRLKHLIGSLFGEGATTWKGLLESSERRRLIKDSHGFGLGASDSLCRSCIFPIALRTLKPTRRNVSAIGGVLREIDERITRVYPSRD